MSSPDIAVKYITDGDIKFRTNGDGDLRGAIYSVYGKAVSSRMTPVDRTDRNGIRIVGYIGEPDLVRANKNSENFFINGRYVKSRTAMAALEQAFATRIPSQKFPVCILNIKLNPAVVDVNVHPSKLEVKFADERVIFEAVYYAVLNSLQNNVSRPEIKMVESTPSSRSFAAYAPETAKRTFAPYAPKGAGEDISPTANKNEAVPAIATAAKQYMRSDPLTAFVPVERTKDSKPENAQMKISGQDTLEMAPVETVEDKPKEAEENALSETGNTQIPDYIIIGEVYNCYVIVQLEDRMLMIDKHAAHERILFDELCRRMETKKRQSQLLMYPIFISISDAEKESLCEYQEQIRAIGFDFNFEPGGGMRVFEIPDELDREGAKNMIEELASVLQASEGSIETTQAKYFEAKLYQASCKAAIKGGRVYTVDHIKWICDRLLKEPGDDGAVIKTCPHGRPVAFEIKKTSIERQFERLV